MCRTLLEIWRVISQLPSLPWHWPIILPKVPFTWQISFTVLYRDIVIMSYFQHGWNFLLFSFIQICRLGAKGCNKYTFTSPSFVGNSESGVSFQKSRFGTAPPMAKAFDWPPSAKGRVSKPRDSLQGLTCKACLLLSSPVSSRCQSPTSRIPQSFFFPFKITFTVLFQMIRGTASCGSELEIQRSIKQKRKSPLFMLPKRYH